MPITFGVEDLRTPERLEWVLRQFQAALTPKPAPGPIAPNLTALAAEIAPLLRRDFEAGGRVPLNLTGLLPGDAPTMIQDTHAARLTLHPPGRYPTGTLYRETDRNAIYAVALIAGVFTWIWIAGVMADWRPALVTDLGPNDTGFLYRVTDYEHLLEWNGSGWQWGPGELGSGYYALFDEDPITLMNPAAINAWFVCDGSTVVRLNRDGSASFITLPDLSTPAYLKGGIVALPAAFSSGETSPALTGIAVGITAAGSGEVQSGAGAVIEGGFTADVTDPGHSHGPGTIELRRVQKQMHYRR
ncbi:MAG TPA: hypothetical protein VFC19_22480 [Candidatus Limnocylindrales bacterium]|nr:hypothetical protein [Candidatus Limnocylindrales bacterium]